MSGMAPSSTSVPWIFFRRSTDMPMISSSLPGSSISSWAKDSVNKCQGMAIISGYNDKTFRPSGTATRAEAAVICGRIVSYAMILPQ